jgi:hypothetical protein
MEYLNLGKTGLKVSRICLGCMTYGSPATGKLLPGRQAWALDETESRPLQAAPPRRRCGGAFAAAIAGGNGGTGGNVPATSCAGLQLRREVFTGRPALQACFRATSSHPGPN